MENRFQNWLSKTAFNASAHPSGAGEGATCLLSPNERHFYLVDDRQIDDFQQRESVGSVAQTNRENLAIADSFLRAGNQFSHGFPFLIGLLAEVYRNVSHKRIAQVDLGMFDRKHQVIGDNPNQGLQKMCRDILRSVLRTLTETEQVVVSMDLIQALRIDNPCLIKKSISMDCDTAKVTLRDR